MTDDFFADLERQLVAATPARAQRLRRARARTATATATVLVALLAGGAGIAAAVSGGDGDDGHRAAPAATPAAVRTTPPPSPADPDLSTFITAVLNGTGTPGLARGVANRLRSFGAKIGNITNAPQQDVATTTVYFARAGAIPKATRIADALSLGNTTLRKEPRAVRILAGASADVVVVAGSDQDTARRP